MRVCGRASEREAERRRGEEREGTCARSLGMVRTGRNGRSGKGRSTCLADARQFRGCAGLDSSTGVPREESSKGLMYQSQSQSYCRNHPILKSRDLE